MATRKGYVSFDFYELDFETQLDYLVLLLQNLPTAIPTGTRIYKFHRPIFKSQDVAATGSQQKAVLKYLESTFGALDCDGNSFIAFQERGEGLDAVVQVLRANIDDSVDESNQDLKSWVVHLLASAMRAYKQHNNALPSLKRVPKPKILDGAGPEPAGQSTVSGKRVADENLDEPPVKKSKQLAAFEEASSDDESPMPTRLASRKRSHIVESDSDVEMVDAPLSVENETEDLSSAAPVLASKAPAAVASIFLKPTAPQPKQNKKRADNAPKKLARSLRNGDTASSDTTAPAIPDDTPPAPSAKAVKAAKKDKSKARVWLWDPADLTDIEEPPPKKLTGNKTGRPRVDIVWALTIPCCSRKTGVKRYRCSQGQCGESFSSRQKERVLPHHIDDCDDVDEALRDEAMAIMGDASLSAKLEKQEQEAASGAAQQTRFNLSVVKLFTSGGLASRLLDCPEWKNLVHAANPRLETFSSTTLTDSYIPQEAMRIRKLSEGTLKKLDNLTISYDGGSNRIVQSVYTVHVTTPDTRQPFFMLGHEASGLSHDAEYIVEICLKVMKRIGTEKFICAVSDSTGSTRKARELLEKACDLLIGLADAPHHINLTLKDICALKYFSLRLQTQAQSNGVTRGLESIGKTRFASVNRAGVSILRNLPSIRELLQERQTYGFLRGNSQYNIYHATMSQLVGVLTPLAKAQKCLESVHVHPGHVLLFWLAALATLQDLFDGNSETLELPEQVLSQIVAIINRRFAEMFDGPSNAVFKAALFLDPAHIKSRFWRKPSQVSTTENAKPDDDLRSTIPFYNEIGVFLLKLLQKHIVAGRTDLLKSRPPKDLATALRVQLPAYARQEFPFNRDSSSGWRPYWTTLAHHPDASILAFLAVKLLSMVPNSMAEERTMSAMTHAQAGRPQLEIRSVVSEVQPSAPIPTLQRFRELSALVRAEVMSSPDDRFVHSNAGRTSAPDGDDAVPAVNAGDVPEGACSAEFNELEAHDTPGDDSADVSTLGFDVRDSVDLSGVFLRDLLSDKPQTGPETATSIAKSASRSVDTPGDYTLDAADFDFDM
ncbi:hypothetical protein AURDEDRAFT_123491 [Auricularia subglabra TFB-10046 SS5]|nr:hypothetical protein AURDEDRAFT_123491 [Auricularia subglabra TFB-10046 SS5]